MSELLVEVTRGEIMESRHAGDLAVVNSRGEILWSVGDPERIIYARSAAKPAQALPLIESGAADAFDMSEEEIALTCASHSGEERHVELVNRFLTRIGISTEALQCGIHSPYHIPSHEQLLRSGHGPTSLHHNCSGKHAGMLAYAKFLGADLNTYLDLHHPVQQHIIQATSEVCEVAREDFHFGVDGCGVPVFALPLRAFALLYAKLADPASLPHVRRTALTRIRQAMIKHPYLVGGTGRFCTALMEAGQGHIVGKTGAEGVYCVGLPDAGSGLCLKVDDGNGRGAEPAVMEVLEQISAVSRDVIEQLAEFHRPQLKNAGGTRVGEIHPVFRVTSSAGKVDSHGLE